MKRKSILRTLQLFFAILSLPATLPAAPMAGAVPKLDGLYYETSAGRVSLPDSLVVGAQENGRSQFKGSDGRTVNVVAGRDGNNLTFNFSAQPDAGILNWGVALEANADEYFTGLMERVVDGPQDFSWATEHHQRNELAGSECGDDRQADDVGLCAVLSFVARLRGVCQGQLAGAVRFLQERSATGENSSLTGRPLN